MIKIAKRYLSKIGSVLLTRVKSEKRRILDEIWAGGERLELSDIRKLTENTRKHY